MELIRRCTGTLLVDAKSRLFGNRRCEVFRCYYVHSHFHDSRIIILDDLVHQMAIEYDAAISFPIGIDRGSIIQTAISSYKVLIEPIFRLIGTVSSVDLILDASQTPFETTHFQSRPIEQDCSDIFALYKKLSAEKRSTDLKISEIQSVLPIRNGAPTFGQMSLCNNNVIEDELLFDTSNFNNCDNKTQDSGKSKDQMIDIPKCHFHDNLETSESELFFIQDEGGMNEKIKFKANFSVLGNENSPLSKRSKIFHSQDPKRATLASSVPCSLPPPSEVSPPASIISGLNLHPTNPYLLSSSVTPRTNLNKQSDKTSGLPKKMPSSSGSTSFSNQPTMHIPPLLLMKSIHASNSIREAFHTVLAAAVSDNLSPSLCSLIWKIKTLLIKMNYKGAEVLLTQLLNNDSDRQIGAIVSFSVLSLLDVIGEELETSNFNSHVQEPQNDRNVHETRTTNLQSDKDNSEEASKWIDLVSPSQPNSIQHCAHRMRADSLYNHLNRDNQNCIENINASLASADISSSCAETELLSTLPLPLTQEKLLIPSEFTIISEFPKHKDDEEINSNQEVKNTSIRNSSMEDEPCEIPECSMPIEGTENLISKMLHTSHSPVIEVKETIKKRVYSSDECNLQPSLVSFPLHLRKVARNKYILQNNNSTVKTIDKEVFSDVTPSKEGVTGCIPSSFSLSPPPSAFSSSSTQAIVISVCSSQ